MAIDPDTVKRTEKYALRFLAASTDTADETFSDLAADIYRERYGEDYGEKTFALAAVAPRAKPTKRETAFAWAVLRGFEDLGGPEVDLFYDEEQATKHAAKFSDAVVREETIAKEAWA